MLVLCEEHTVVLCFGSQNGDLRQLEYGLAVADVAYARQ